MNSHTELYSSIYLLVQFAGLLLQWVFFLFTRLEILCTWMSQISLLLCLSLGISLVHVRVSCHWLEHWYY